MSETSGNLLHIPDTAAPQPRALKREVMVGRAVRRSRRISGLRDLESPNRVRSAR